MLNEKDIPSNFILLYINTLYNINIYYILYIFYIVYINHLVTYCKAKLQCPDSNLALIAIFFQKFLNVVKYTLVLAILYVFDNKPFKPRFLK